MSETADGERLVKLETVVSYLVERVSSLEATIAKLAWIVVGAVVTALLAMVLSGGR